MNKNNVSALVATAILGKAIYDFTKFHSQQKEIRRNIAAREKAEIEAIHTARDVVLAKIRNGEYRSNTGLKDILTDFKFYQIAHLEK